MIEPAAAQHLLSAIDVVTTRHFAALAGNDAALVDAVRAVSDAYTRRGAALPSLQRDPRALFARLRFFLPRDLPKLVGPLSELRLADALPAGGAVPDASGSTRPGSDAGNPLRVLDLGAGLGTTSLGAALCLARGPDARALQITALDMDPEVLPVLRDLLETCRPMFDRPVEVRVERGDLAVGPRGARPGSYDLILAGLSLNEALQSRDDATDAGLRLLRHWASWLSPDGALVVIEPALRTQSRRLQALRTMLIAEGGPPYVFGPCTHHGPCPLLERERDWCHEMLPLSLPAPLQAIARAAGLRERGLSYAYLTLHARDRRLGDRARTPWLRGVSAALGSKGKTELQLCGPAGLQRLFQLDRKRQEAMIDLQTLGRGTLLSIEVPAGVPSAPNLRVDKAEAVHLHRAWSESATVIHPPVEPRP